MNKLNQTTTISQRKVLSQQTRQAIRLLQLNSYDLEREVDNLVLENPLLEKNEEIESNYDSATAVGSISTDSEEILKYHKKYDSLQESLTKQLDLTSLSDDEKIIGTIIIDCVKIFAIITTFYGVLVACHQTNLKSIISFFSIGNTGFILLYAVTPTLPEMNEQFFLFLLFYSVIMTLNIQLINLNKNKIKDLKDLNFLFQRRPKFATALFASLFLFFSSIVPSGLILNFKFFMTAYSEKLYFELILIIATNLCGGAFLISKVLVIFKRFIKVKKKLILAK